MRLKTILRNRLFAMIEPRTILKP